MEHRDNFVVNLKVLLFSALYSWKKIAVAILVCGIVLGGIRAYSIIDDAKEDISSENPEINLTTEENSLNEYKYWVEVTEEKLESLKQYVENSVLMKIDYHEVYKAKSTYFIDVNYQIQPGSVYQDIDYTSTLLEYYKKYLEDYSLCDEIAAEVGLETRYLQELVTVGIDGNSSISISVLHAEEDQAKKIKALFEENMNAIHNILNETVCTHSMTRMLDSCGAYVDYDLYYNQREDYDAIVEYQTKLIQMKQELSNLESNTVIAENSAPGLKSIIKQFIKWAIMGGAAGAVLLVMVVWMEVVFSDRISSTEKLMDSFTLDVLGMVAVEEKKYDKITSWIRKIEGRLAENTEDNSQYVAANLLNHVDGHKNILVCSDVGTQGTESVVRVLQGHAPDVTLLAAGSLVNDAQALKLLRKADAVVLAVMMNKSCCKDISASIKHIQKMNKTLAGVIVVD